MNIGNEKNIDSTREHNFLEAKESALLKPFVERLRAEGTGAWKDFFGHILRSIHVEAEYTKDKTEGYEAMRTHLETEPGILIANHPSVLDMIVVLAGLERKDILIMLQRKRFDFFEDLFGKDNILRAPEGGGEITEAIERASQHVQNGGLFIIFPSGGIEISTGEMRFNSGLRLLLSKVDPDSMVYSYYIDPAISKTVKEDMMGAPRDASDAPMMLAPELHVRPAQDGLVVKIDEAYSNAQEWQDIITANKELDPIRQNNLLQRNFEKKFGGGGGL